MPNWPELDARLDKLDDAIEQLTALIEARLPEGEVRWFGIERAAQYVDSTPDALRKAERAGHLRGHRGTSGRLSFERRDLDAYVTNGHR